MSFSADPKYKSLITKYEDGSTSTSGYFIAQGSGWTGIESGADPREGYFNFVDGLFELITGPNNDKTEKLLNEIRRYNDDVAAAYLQAESDSDNDFERLGKLLKDNLYSWWD